MDKGIRPACNAKFLELLPTRENTTKGNTVFRKSVMASIMEDFGITLASAATHYNHAFQAVKTATPALVEGLGRADDKKGGRKPKAVAADAPAVSDVLLSNILAARSGNEGETAQAVPETAQAVQEPVLQLAAPVLVRVCKVSDGTVVAEGLTQAAAEELVAKAAAAKKAKLAIA
jgi:hypothetical protein